MTAVRRLLNQRWLAALLVAAALAVKLAVPAGFMLGNKAGLVTVELCASHGRQTIQVLMPNAGGAPSKSERGTAEMPCAFAGLAAAADLLPIETLVPPVAALPVPAPALARSVAIGRGLVAPPPPATGPPAAV